MPNENGSGLGPGFNSNSCSSCHAQPAVGGSSPAVNPQFSLATLDNATNQLPEFILANGPVREVRFISKPDGTPDGGVHDLFTIAGRTDAPGCVDAQPDFATAVAQGNAIFRIPTPMFGAGLVETISDAAILANAAANANAKAQYGIAGVPNHSGNDGSITRFGWKAQNKSLLIFSGEAYNVEQGVTNELFPNERDTTPGCQFGGKAEDDTPMAAPSTFPPSGYSSDTVNFAMFARLSAPPTPARAMSFVLGDDLRRALADGGVDLFILETFRDLNEIGAAIDAVRSVCDLPIVAQMTTEEDGNTLDGTPPERFAPELERRGATVIGDAAEQYR